MEKIENKASLFHISFLFFIGFITYFKALFGDFLWDDLDEIPNNPIISHLQNIPYFFTHGTFYSSATQQLIGLYYRPTTMVVVTFLYQVWGLNTFGYHLFDITVHIANSVLVFFLVKKLFKLNNTPFSKVVGFLAAIIFLVHPANTEAVAYVGGTSDILCAFFLLLTLNFTLSYGMSKKTLSFSLLYSVISVLLCLFTKESGILAVFFALLLCIIYFPKKLPILSIFFILSGGFYSYVRFHLVQLSSSYHTSLIPIFNVSIWQRLLLIPYELSSYLRLIFFPFDLHIGEQGIIRSINDPKFFMPLIFVLFVLFCLTFIFWKIKSKIALFFLCWICISILPFLNIVPLDFTVEERWLYIPLIGAIGFISVCVIKLLNTYKHLKKPVAIVVCLYLIFFSIRTFVRTFDWSSELTLFSHDVNYSNPSSELHTNYANALYRAGNINVAKDEFTRAIQLAPDNFYALNNLGSIYAQGGDYKYAKTLFEKSLQVAPTIQGYENIAEIDYLTEKPQQVLIFVKPALATYPNSAKLNQIAALSLVATGNINEAKIYAQKSLMLDQSADNINALRQFIK